MRLTYAVRMTVGIPAAAGACFPAERSAARRPA
jgi:hypothetical protein